MGFIWDLYGYGSIPINTIFSGMNIHLPAILMFTRGTRFWHTAIWGWHEFLGVVWCCLKIWKPNPLVKIIILRSKMTYAPQRAESTSGSPSKRFHSGALEALGALEEWSLACEIGWSKNLPGDYLGLRVEFGIEHLDPVSWKFLARAGQCK